MIRKTNIARQTLTLFLGVMLSAIVLLQVVCTASTVENQLDLTEQNDAENSQTEATISQAIPNSTTQINLGFDSYLLDEVTFSEENNKKPTSSELIATGIHKSIRVLLKKIISPNAP